MAAHRSLVAALFALIFCTFSFVAVQGAAAAEPRAASAAPMTFEPAAMIPAQAPPSADANDGIGTSVVVAGSILLGAGVITTMTAVPVRRLRSAGAPGRLRAVAVAA